MGPFQFPLRPLQESTTLARIMVCFNNVVATTLLVTLLLNFSNAIQIEHLPRAPALTTSAEPIVFNNGITVANEGKTFTLPCGGRGVSSFQWYYLQDGKTDTIYVYDGKNLTDSTDIDYDRIRINDIRDPYLRRDSDLVIRDMTVLNAKVTDNGIFTCQTVSEENQVIAKMVYHVVVQQDGHKVGVVNDGIIKFFDGSAPKLIGLTELRDVPKDELILFTSNQH